MKALRTKETTYCRVSQTERDSMRGVLESILEMGEGLWNKKDEKNNRFFFSGRILYLRVTGYLIWSWDEPHIRTVTSSPEIYYTSTYWHIPGVQSPNTRSWLPSRNPMANPRPVAVNARKQKYVRQLFTSVYIAWKGWRSGTSYRRIGEGKVLYSDHSTATSIGLVSSTFSLRATERNHLGTTSIRTVSSSLEDPHEQLVPHLFFSIYMALYALPQASSFKFTD